MLLSVKTKEHIRRRFFALLPKYGTLLGGAAFLGATLVFTGTMLHQVTVQDSAGASGSIITAAQNVDAICRQIGITPAGPEDEVLRQSGLGFLSLQINRAYTISLTADGTTRDLTVTGGDVADALAKAGVEVDGDDLIEPALDTKTTQGMAVTVKRIEYVYRTEKEDIQAETQYIDTSLYYRQQGYETEVQAGSDGVAYVDYRDTYVDGVLATTEETGRNYEVEMVPHIIKRYGEKAPVSKFEGPEIVDGRPVSGVANTFTSCRATGYSASPTAKGASGRRLTYGTVAINPNVIPYGSLMYITSDDGRFVYGYAYAADTGIAMMDGRAFIDLYYETYNESVKNAVISVSIYVLDSDTAAQYKEANDAILAADTIAGQ